MGGAVKTCLSYRLKIASLNPNDATAISGQEGRHAYSLFPMNHSCTLRSCMQKADCTLVCVWYTDACHLLPHSPHTCSPQPCMSSSSTGFMWHRWSILPYLVGSCRVIWWKLPDSWDLATKLREKIPPFFCVGGEPLNQSERQGNFRTNGNLTDLEIGILLHCQDRVKVELYKCAQRGMFRDVLIPAF